MTVMTMVMVTVMVLVAGISCSPEGYKGTAGACSCDNGYRGSVSYDYEKNAPTGCTGQLKWNCIGHPCHEFGMAHPPIANLDLQ